MYISGALMLTKQRTEDSLDAQKRQQKLNTAHFSISEEFPKKYAFALYIIIKLQLSICKVKYAWLHIGEIFLS